ncbi:MAG TPA: biotin/lipoyl-containing protein [Saprospiraceae bacterium]|nr:biotin/lipoyl-containing protein [Saprospiraceae bacterium]
MSLPSTPVTVEIDSQRFQWLPEEWRDLDCIATGENEFHVIENGKSHWITVLEFDLRSRSCVLKVDGEIKQVKFLRELDLMIERMGLNAVQVNQLKNLIAPMPGLVTGIKTEAGQEVEKGTPLLILEAMKMENVIVAPHQAIIKEIKVIAGQAVEKGTVLLEFE